MTVSELRSKEGAEVQPIADPATRRTGTTGWLRYLVPAALLLLLLAAGLLAYRAWPAQEGTSNSGTPQLASAKTFEERFGLSVTLVAVTASGGIVDIRFKVLDADKALGTLQDDKNMPILNVEGSTITPMMRDTAIQDQDLEVGKVYYILYSNPRGMVKPGTPVSVAIGDLVLEPIIAQ